MKVGKSYWEVTIRNEAARKSMPNKEYQQARRELRQQAAQVLGNRFEFATEKEAMAAKKKLPKEMQGWVEVAETWPVSLGLGWC